VHRDLKPANILITPKGHAKVLDFGLAKWLKPGEELTADHKTDSLTAAGTLPYMSPEQAAGKSGLDPRSDIYSLGAVAYFLLTGQPPFVRETAMQVLMAHVYEQVPPLAELRPDVPPDLAAVVLRCLEKDPARRFPSVEALDEALEQCACAGQ